MAATTVEPGRHPVAHLLETPGTADALGATLAAILATVGFRSVFGGSTAMVAILLGAAAAATLSIVAIRATWSSLTVLLADIGAFFLLACPLAASDRALGGVLPSPGALRSVVDALVHGWRELATLTPPVTDAPHLVVLPLFCSFASVALSLAIARLTKRRALATVPPVIVLGIVTLEGTTQPFSLLVQSSLLIVVLLLWAKRLVPKAAAVGHFGGANRLVGITTMLLAMALAAPLVGSSLPFLGTNDRYLLRDHIEVPFDPNAYPSPLSQFRSFRRDKQLKPAQQQEFLDHELLELEGMPKDGMLRFAVMSDYDGTVWRVSSDLAPNPFLRAAGTLSPGAPGTVRDITVRVPEDGLDGVWLPLAGMPTDIDFEGPRTKELTAAFRYSPTLDAGAVIGGLQPGDVYTFSASFPAAARDCDIGTLGPSTLGAVTAMPKTVEEQAQKVLRTPSGRPTTVRDQIARITEALDGPNGYYGDGDDPYREPGHYAGLIEDFVAATSRLGNDEQYAAAAALYARANGIPARVVLGATPKVAKDGTATVHRNDVRAWIEVPDPDGQWIPCRVAPDRSDDDYQQLDPPPDPKPNVAPRVIIPPYPPQADDLGDLSTSTAGRRTKAPEKETTNQLAASALRFLVWGSVPLLVVGAPIGAILFAKRRRRRARRTRGTGVRRMVGAWQDVADLTRDLGWPVATNATRLEIASMHGQPQMVELATLINASTFGIDPADPSDVERSWAMADGVRAHLLSGLSRAERFRAALSLTSLRRPT